MVHLDRAKCIGSRKSRRVEKIEAHIADAVKKGVTGITGGTRVAAFSFRLVKTGDAARSR